MQSLEVEIKPWGRYEVLLDSIETKVKLITVEPRQRLSYQSHKKRQEHWTVVKGTLLVVLNDEHKIVCEGESIFIPKRAKHRAWNKLDEVCQFVEVQTGTYFGEDDIERYEDDYMRADDVQEFLEHMDKPGPWSEEDSRIHTIGGLTNDKEGSFMKFQNKINKNG